MATQFITSGSPIDNDASIVRGGGTNNTRHDVTVALGTAPGNTNPIGGAATAGRGFQSLAGGGPGEVTDTAKMVDLSIADQIPDNYPGKTSDRYPTAANPLYLTNASYYYNDWTYLIWPAVEPTIFLFGALDNATPSYGEDRPTQFTFSNGSKISPSGSH